MHCQLAISQHFSCSWKLQFARYRFVCFCTENYAKLCSSPQSTRKLRMFGIAQHHFCFSCQRFCDCCVAKIFVYGWPFNPTRVLWIYYLSQCLQIRELAVGTLQSKYRFCLSAMNCKLSSFCKQYLHVYNFLL